MNIRTPFTAAVILTLPLACAGGSGEEESDTGSGGSAVVSGAGGGASSGGGLGSGGGLASGGGLGTGGDFPASGGGFGTGGESSGGGPSSGGADGAGGMDAGTGGGGNSAANPSPGCAQNTPRPENGIVYQAGESWLLFPEKYDGTTPLPVVVGFHGCGSGNKGTAQNTEFKGHFDGTDIGDNYVRALPLSINDGGCYDQPGDMARAKDLFTELVDNYCVDLDRVFGVGHSYGAGYLMGMTANAGDFNHFGFRGIAPVAGWEINSANIQVPTMYVQGIMDQERSGGDGANVAARVAQVNGCETSSTDFPTIACNSSSGGAAVDSGCILYDGCDETTVWCRHNDQAYGTSYHGIPCFFNETVFDFFESL